MLGYFNPFRPNANNGVLAPDVPERIFWKTKKPVKK